MEVTEYSGRKTITTDVAQNPERLYQPRVGDIVDLSLVQGHYPFQQAFGTIDELGPGRRTKEGEAHICCGPHSTFLAEAAVEIAGGPFEKITLSRLKPTGQCRPQAFWNWGQHTCNPGNAVRFTALRPVFQLSPQTT